MPARRSTSMTVLLAGAALVLVPAMTTGAVAEDGPGLRRADHASAPRVVSTRATTKSAAVAGQISPLARTGGPAPAPASCVDVAVATGASPAGGYLPLSAFGIAPLSGQGDETLTNVNVPEFRYGGTSNTRIGISANGYVQVGGGSSTTFINQSLPDAAAPNAVLAPYWTDLNPAVGGAIRAGAITDGTSTWIVVDWDGVPEFSTSGRTHQFQVWIGISGDQTPGEDVSFVYGAQNGNGDGGFLTVGAENNTGTSGQNYYVDGVGVLPGNGTQLAVTAGGGGPVADFTATPLGGDAPLHVAFDGSASTDDGSLTAYDWDFGDGAGGTGATTNHDYAGGTWTASLTVTDDDGNTCTATRSIVSNGGFSVGDVSVDESAGTATFTVVRSGGAAATVDVSVVPGSASAPADYTATPATLSFPSGATSEEFTVDVVQDALDEPDESYSVVLGNPSLGPIVDGTGLGTIVDDDAAVRVSVGDAAVTEGNSGTRNLVFTLSLDNPSGKTVTVRAQTANGSARAPSDYARKSVTVTFDPGETTTTVSVAVKGDKARERNETLFLLLDRPVNATVVDPSGTGGIINDD